MIWGYVDDATQMIGVVSALAITLIWLIVEAALHHRALSLIPVRVHVAGSRGKTTVTRLIGAGLDGAGLSVLVKTTGTVPLIILPDGSEQPWPRRGLPAIGEQIRVARLAARLKVDAIVIESMAIQPEYLWASERYLMRATHAVITNLRPDHAEELGEDPADIASALALVTPTRGRLVLSPEAGAPQVLQRAKALGTQVEVVDDVDVASVNREMALAVCASLVTDLDRVRAGMDAVKTDPGQFFVTTVDTASGPVSFAAAFACNDPISFMQLWKTQQPPLGTVVLFNGRADRPLRTEAFLQLFACLSSDIKICLAGAIPPGAVRKAGIPEGKVTRLQARSAARALEELALAAGESRTIWGVGNFSGIGARISERLQAEKQPKTC